MFIFFVLVTISTPTHYLILNSLNFSFVKPITSGCENKSALAFCIFHRSPIERITPKHEEFPLISA